MNIVDIILLIIFAWFAYQGFKKGFIIELESLIALIMGIYAAIFFSYYAENFLRNSLDMNNDYIPVTSFVITFIVVVIIVYVIGRILEKLVNMVALGFINKLAGGVFGILKSVLFLSIILLIMNHYNINFIPIEKRNNSMIYSPIEEIAPFIWSQLDELNDEKIEEFKEKVEDSEIYHL
jgi:membrane protein required for colicin V production